MSPPLSAALTLSLLSTLLALTHATLTLTVVNHCPYTVWAAIVPNAGFPDLERSGFALPTNSHYSLAAPAAHWSGRIWGRTGCVHHGHEFICATGDCGRRFECGRLGGAPPATLAQLSFHHGGADFASYGVSLVDGFNVPMTVTPHEGKGRCPVVGCRENLVATCPHNLKFYGPHGAVLGCKSGCEAFNTDDLCCRNHYNSKETCRPNGYSEFFKKACPETFTYAHDTPSLIHECSSPRELKVIFCQP